MGDLVVVVFWLDSVVAAWSPCGLLLLVAVWLGWHLPFVDMQVPAVRAGMHAW